MCVNFPNMYLCKVYFYNLYLFLFLVFYLNMGTAVLAVYANLFTQNSWESTGPNTVLSVVHVVLFDVM